LWRTIGRAELHVAAAAAVGEGFEIGLDGLNVTARHHAGKFGGTGDEAVGCALEVRSLTPDLGLCAGLHA